MKLWSTGLLTMRCGAPSKEVDRWEGRASWALCSGDFRTGTLGAASVCVRQTRLNGGSWTPTGMRRQGGILSGLRRESTATRASLLFSSDARVGLAVLDAGLARSVLAAPFLYCTAIGALSERWSINFAAGCVADGERVYLRLFRPHGCCGSSFLPRQGGSLLATRCKRGFVWSQCFGGLFRVQRIDQQVPVKLVLVERSFCQSVHIQPQMGYAMIETRLEDSPAI